MIKNFLRQIIAWLLRQEAKLVLRKYRPKIVGITGSVGKTGAKEAVAQVLGARFRVRKSQKSFNHELGIPLTILGGQNAWWNPLGWARNLLEGLSLIIFRADYPEWLVLEVGVERPGDITRLLKWLKFEVAVLTRLPEIPVHVEFFQSPEELTREKLLLAQGVGATGVAVLNQDDEKIMAAAREWRAGQTLTYGWDEAATVRASGEQIMYQTVGTERQPDGLAFRVDYGGSMVPFRIRGLLARHQLYGVLAAVAVGLSQGLNLLEIAESLSEFETPPGRFKLLAGIKQSLLVDDSYNSSPAALEAALETLAQIETPGRKICVLGDMMELGQHTVAAHRLAGSQAAQACHLLVTVGVRAKLMVEAAERRRLGKRKVFSFLTADEAKLKVQELIEPGDVILVKGSQSVRLERLVEEIMAEPERAGELLVRQEPEWQRIP